MSDTSATLISGYELAKHLFAKGGVSALLKMAGDDESDWLELKAGLCLTPEDEARGEKPKDLYWNIAKEIIALMNTSGGALVLGVADKTLKLVRLEENDPQRLIEKGGVEAYIRGFVRPNILPESFSWTFRNKVWELRSGQLPADLLTWHHGVYVDPDGEAGEVVVLLVKPVGQVLMTRSEKTYYSLIKRTRGDLGEAKPIYDPAVVDEYKRTREIASERYAVLRDRFDQMACASADQAKLDHAIESYYAALARKAKEHLAVFTSLDAEENSFDAGEDGSFYSPEAIETLEDDDWLGDDDDEFNLEEDEDDEAAEDESSEDGLGGTDADAKDEQCPSRMARKGDLLSLLAEEPRAIVSGEPGGGKTTCLTYYTLQFGRQDGAERQLAVFIPMGQWGRGGSLELLMSKATGLDSRQLTDLIAKRRLRLVIDAVNECPDHFRMAAIQNIRGFLFEHPTVPVVISTRHPSELQELQMPVFQVRPMDEVHRRRYLERYLKDPEQAEKLLRQINAMPGGETIAENPMLLRLVVEVYRSSPGGHLPKGRAGLYRRSLHSWYKRELGKALKAGGVFPWDEKTSLSFLSELAFKGRQQGYRDVPLESVEEIWQSESSIRLDFLCQGPVVCRDSKYVRFRHETFQEYLCAEYLFRHPDALSNVSPSDYSRWGMPLAYAVELFEQENVPFPESLWSSAWSLNPWLGVALTGESKAWQLESRGYTGLRPSLPEGPLGKRIENRVVGLPYLRCCHRRLVDPFRFFLRDVSVYKPVEANQFGLAWYASSDAVLKYVVSVSPAVFEKWNQFELGQLQLLDRLRVHQAITVAKNWLTRHDPRELFRYHAPQKWDRWISTASPRLASELIDSSLAVASDFEQVKQQWFYMFGKKRGIELVDRGVLTRDDWQLWVKDNNAQCPKEIALELYARGFISREDLESHLGKWIQTATPDAAVELLRAGLAREEDFVAMKPFWIQGASPLEIVQMTTGGLASKEECLARITALVETASPELAGEMVRLGLATVGDFQERLPWWSEIMTASEVVQAVQDGFCPKTYFAERINCLISCASPLDACVLMRASLAEPSDFAGRLDEWLNDEQYSSLSEFARNFGLAAFGEKAASHVSEWIASASLGSAVALILDGFATCADFGGKIQLWKEFATRTQWGLLARSGLATLNECKRHCDAFTIVKSVVSKLGREGGVASDLLLKIRGWVQDAPLCLAKKMVTGHIVSTEDFQPRLEGWMSLVPDNQRASFACLLVKWKLAAPGDFAELRGGWVGKAALSDVMSLLETGILSREDVLQCKPYLIEHSTAQELSHFVKAGLLSSAEIQGRTERWVKDRKWLELLWLQVAGALNDRDVQHDEFLMRILKERVVVAKIIGRVEAGYRVLVEGVEGRLPFAEIDEPWSTRFRIGSSYALRLMVPKMDIGVQKPGFNVSQREFVRYKLIRTLKQGQACRGRVKNIVDTGAFIDIGGVNGMLHLKDMSWGRVRHPSEMFAVGQELDVIVLDVDLEKERVSLGFKQLTRNPWLAVPRQFPVGCRVKGKVANLVAYGAFVEIAPGIEGLVHVSEFSWTRKVTRASDMLNIGDEIMVQVLSVDAEDRKIALSIRQTQENPWDGVADRYPVGSRVKGRVCNFTSYGAFVELEDGITGMVHVTDVSWMCCPAHPSECLTEGEEIEAVVLDVDAEKQRIALGLKQAQADPIPGIVSKYKVGSIVKGRVRKTASFGAFVEVEEGVDGLVHVSQIGGDQKDVKVKELFPVGQVVTARVVRIDPAAHRIGLSIKAVGMDEVAFAKLLQEVGAPIEKR